jgi:NADH:ubiquinone oxidoreductase subunit 3 (subunit A)
MSNWILFVPPVAFVVLFTVSIILFSLLSKFAYKNASESSGKRKSYSCGEDVPVPRVEFDYKQFYSFALFFTIMHVVALVLFMVPEGAMMTHGIAFVYLVGVVTGVVILFKR